MKTQLGILWLLWLSVGFGINGSAAAQPKAQLEPFQVEYSATYSLGWLNLKIVGHQRLVLQDDGLWRLTFVAETSGASLSEESKFSLAQGKILPYEYQYSTAGLLRKTPQHQRFDASHQVIEDLAKEHIYTDLWQENLQDNLTYILQASLDLAAGKTDLEYHFYHKGQIKSYRYQVVGKEMLATAVGSLKTVKLKRMDSSKRTIYAWFATEHQHRLVRLAELKDGKVAYEINVAKLE